MLPATTTPQSTLPHLTASNMPSLMLLHSTFPNTGEYDDALDDNGDDDSAINASDRNNAGNDDAANDDAANYDVSIEDAGDYDAALNDGNLYDTTIHHANVTQLCRPQTIKVWLGKITFCISLL
jgi:hypothetical protein